MTPRSWGRSSRVGVADTVHREASNPYPGRALTGPDSMRLLLLGPRVLGDPLLAALEVHWRAAGLIVVDVGFEPDAPPDEQDRAVIEAAADHPGPLILGGFSLGARIAVRVAPTVRPRGLLCLGYPFHVRGEPKNRPGLEALQTVSTPTLIVQGSRDAHGSRQEVRSCGPLPSCVDVLWLEDGNHRFRPRERSGLCEEGHVRDAAETSIAFISRLGGEAVRG